MLVEAGLLDLSHRRDIAQGRGAKPPLRELGFCGVKYAVRGALTLVHRYSVPLVRSSMDDVSATCKSGLIRKVIVL